MLGWSAKQTATTLDTTVASANSALQRARETMRRQVPDRRLDWSSSPKRQLTRHERTLLERYMDAHVRGDAEGLAALLSEDLRFAMPPEPGSWIGRDTIVQSCFGSDSFGRWRCTLVWANRQPAIASYLRRPNDTKFRAFAIDVLMINDREITEIMAFTLDTLEHFGLPPTLN